MSNNATDKTLDKNKVIAPTTNSADEYSLEGVYIVSNAGVTNIKAMVVEMSYFEDIFRGAITGEIMVNDSLSMIDTMPLTGFEYVRLSFQKTAKSKERIDRFFRIYRISDRLRLNNNNESYIINFCSEELFLSEQNRISRSFVGKKVEDMVYSIMKNDLMVPDKKMVIGKTEGLYDIAMPYQKPFEAINWLASYAKPLNGIGADFVFYESIDSFNFISLQELYKRKSYASFTYSVRGYTPDLLQQLTIKGYKFLDTFDTLYGFHTGAFGNHLLAVDPLTRTHNDYFFNYGTYNTDSKAKRLNQHLVVTSLKNRKGQKPIDSVYSRSRTTITNKGRKLAKGIADKGYQSYVASDFFVEQTLPYRMAQLSLSNYTRLEITVSGDPNITVGMTINVTLPSARKEGYDAHHSGKYLVTSVRQMINANLKYETIMEVAKDSYGAGIPTNNNNEVFREAIK